MSLIEQAAKRLNELRRAGAAVPETDVPTETVAAGAVAQAPAEAVAAEIPNTAAGEAPAAARGGESRVIDLDLSRLGAAGFVTPSAARSQIADEFRVVKRPLLANAAGKGAAGPIKNGNLIMVTSALPGEGKSFSATNLAMSIAMELDRTVLLVDADVARPSLPGMLGFPPPKGLLDVLEDPDIELGQVLYRTNVEKLTLLASGTQHPRAAELLASDAMAQLLDEMAQRYSDRIIIFDSPPLLVTTESRVLATHMGQIVFVVKAESTTHAAVKEALATIESCPIRLMMLNQAENSTPAGYGYGYGYGYGR